jgi:hypothetical protein
MPTVAMISPKWPIVRTATTVATVVPARWTASMTRRTTLR